jgi:hypothetical protein
MSHQTCNPTIPISFPLCDSQDDSEARKARFSQVCAAQVRAETLKPLMSYLILDDPTRPPPPGFDLEWSGWASAFVHWQQYYATTSSVASFELEKSLQSSSNAEEDRLVYKIALGFADIPSSTVFTRAAAVLALWKVSVPSEQRCFPLPFIVRRGIAFFLDFAVVATLWVIMLVSIVVYPIGQADGWGVKLFLSDAAARDCFNRNDLDCLKGAMLMRHPGLQSAIAHHIHSIGTLVFVGSSIAYYMCGSWLTGCNTPGHYVMGLQLIKATPNSGPCCHLNILKYSIFTWFLWCWGEDLFGSDILCTDLFGVKIFSGPTSSTGMKILCWVDILVCVCRTLCRQI